ncbi:hypothetical protein HAX54_024816 [Datura stramonium]|uniref:Transmembrane protein n=1 Tax=Datura stramonium TaxID=4076 RepID=A0ABS8S6N4_DATST|nr:hypothetical protein [Datura stramonium]
MLLEEFNNSAVTTGPDFMYWWKVPITCSASCIVDLMLFFGWVFALSWEMDKDSKHLLWQPLSIMSFMKEILIILELLLLHLPQLVLILILLQSNLGIGLGVDTLVFAGCMVSLSSGKICIAMRSYEGSVGDKWLG